MGIETLRDLSEIRIGRVATGIRGLDEVLGGGLPVGTVTEVYGEFGSGKTQLCHQLAVNVQLPREEGGLEGKAVYIDTEGTFRAERIVQMAKARGLDPDKALENILVARVGDMEGLERALRHILRWGVEIGVEVLLVDSLSTYLRWGYGAGGLIGRYKAAVLSVSMLRRIAYQNGVVVVFTSKVASRIDDGGERSASGLWVESRVNTIIRLRKDGFGGEAVVEYSSYSPTGKARFIIAENGLVAVG